MAEGASRGTGTTRICARAAPALALATLATVLGLLLAPARGEATPQVNAALSVGGGARFVPGSAPLAVFSMALRADVLFGGAGPYVARFGPFAAVRSDAFEDLVAAAGLSLQLPVSSTYPLVLSAGGVLDVTRATAQGAPRAGVVGRLWWGSRSYNYHSPYGLAAGVWVEARGFLDAAGGGLGASDVVFGADIDLELFAIPVILLYNWVAR